jgi:hypothetical protein
MQPDHPWHGYEGRQVSITLGDGTRIDDGVLVSVGRGQARTLWIFAEGVDMFIPQAEVGYICLSSQAAPALRAA